MRSKFHLRLQDSPKSQQTTAILLLQLCFHTYILYISTSFSCTSPRCRGSTSCSIHLNIPTSRHPVHPSSFVSTVAVPAFSASSAIWKVCKFTPGLLAAMQCCASCANRVHSEQLERFRGWCHRWYTRYLRGDVISSGHQPQEVSIMSRTQKNWRRTLEKGSLPWKIVQVLQVSHFWQHFRQW